MSSFVWARMSSLRVAVSGMMLTAAAQAWMLVTLQDHTLAGSPLMAATACVTAAATSAQLTPRCGREAWAVRPWITMSAKVLEVWRTAAAQVPVGMSWIGRTWQPRAMSTSSTAPDFRTSSAPWSVSSPGWKRILRVPRRTRPASSEAAASTIAQWLSWPQAWTASIEPSSFLKGRASMSARSIRTGPCSAPLMTPMTPVFPTPRVTA